jgi:dihydroneopterin aldolase
MNATVAPMLPTLSRNAAKTGVDPTIEEYTLRLTGIRFLAHLGASSSERLALQEVVVDVELILPVSSLPVRDRLRNVVDYDAVARAVVEEGIAKPRRLLETYVARVVGRLLAETPATRVRVAATKRRPPTTHPVAAAIVEIVGARPTSAASVIPRAHVRARRLRASIS